MLIDVTDTESINKAYDYISESLNDETFSIINNAGVSISCPIEFIDIEKFKQQFDVNVTGQIRIIQKFLPLLRKSKGK